MARLDRCPACNLPYALIGRVHRCVQRSAPGTATVLHTVPEQMDTADNQAEPVPALAGIQADAPAIGANQSAMCVTPPATGVSSEHLHDRANRGEPASIHIGVDLAQRGDVSATTLMERQPDGSVNVTTIISNRRPPKRDRAAYMRSYRALQKAKKAGGVA